MSHNKKVKKENTEVKFVERSNEKKKVNGKTYG